MKTEQEIREELATYRLAFVRTAHPYLKQAASSYISALEWVLDEGPWHPAAVPYAGCCLSAPHANPCHAEEP